MSNLIDRMAVCSWSLRARNPDELGDLLKQCGVRATQLALVPVMQLPDAWADVSPRLALRGVSIVSGMLGTIGEDYSTLQTIQQTGGFVPDDKWDANFERAKKIALIARKLGLKIVSCHAGFIPPDASDPTYAKLTNRLRSVADVFADCGLDLLLETGQETAETLSAFLTQLDRRNVGVNFDPANMILYDKGDPIASLQKLLPRVKQVHIKDAVRTKTPGEWGTEVAVGAGEVDWRKFMAVLRGAGFTGNRVIEREAGENRIIDIRQAAELLARVK